MVANTSLLGDYKVHTQNPLTRPHLVRLPNPLTSGLSQWVGEPDQASQRAEMIIDPSGHWRGVRAGGGAEPAPESAAPQISVKENVSTTPRTLCLFLKYKKRRITNMCYNKNPKLYSQHSM